VTHRGRPEGWYPEAPFYFVDGIEAAMAKAQELAGGRVVEVSAGDVGGQVLAAGLIDEVRMDVVPVVFASGKRYFGSVHAQHLLEDPVRGDSGQPGAPPTLSSAPLTELSGYANKFAANCDTSLVWVHAATAARQGRFQRSVVRRLPACRLANQIVSPPTVSH
jgi:hypothetical protein